MNETKCSAHASEQHSEAELFFAESRRSHKAVALISVVLLANVVSSVATLIAAG